MRRIVVVVFVFGLAALVSGCAALTRTARGTAKGTAITAHGFSTGITKDTKDTANAIMRADQWIRENLW